MNGFALLLAMTAVGVDYGWQRTDDGQLEYIIQIEPEMLETLRDEGVDLVSLIHPEAGNISRLRIRVGQGPLPRQVSQAGREYSEPGLLRTGGATALEPDDARNMLAFAGTVPRPYNAEIVGGNGRSTPPNTPSASPGVGRSRYEIPRQPGETPPGAGASVAPGSGSAYPASPSAGGSPSSEAVRVPMDPRGGTAGGQAGSDQAGSGQPGSGQPGSSTSPAGSSSSSGSAIFRRDSGEQDVSGQTAGGQTAGGQSAGGQFADGQSADGRMNDGQMTGGRSTNGQTTSGQVGSSVFSLDQPTGSQPASGSGTGGSTPTGDARLGASGGDQAPAGQYTGGQYGGSGQYSGGGQPNAGGQYGSGGQSNAGGMGRLDPRYPGNPSSGGAPVSNPDYSFADDRGRAPGSAAPTGAAPGGYSPYPNGSETGRTAGGSVTGADTSAWQNVPPREYPADPRFAAPAYGGYDPRGIRVADSQAAGQGSGQQPNGANPGYPTLQPPAQNPGGGVDPRTGRPFAGAPGYFAPPDDGDPQRTQGDHVYIPPRVPVPAYGESSGGSTAGSSAVPNAGPAGEQPTSSPASHSPDAAGTGGVSVGGGGAAGLPPREYPAEEERPWVPLTLTVFGLLLSLGANAYLAWIALGLHTRYRELVYEMRHARTAAAA